MRRTAMVRDFAVFARVCVSLILFPHYRTACSHWNRQVKSRGSGEVNNIPFLAIVAVDVWCLSRYFLGLRWRFDADAMDSVKWSVQ
jgi:hypothetical protein